MVEVGIPQLTLGSEVVDVRGSSVEVQGGQVSGPGVMEDELGDWLVVTGEDEQGTVGTPVFVVGVLIILGLDLTLLYPNSVEE